MSDEQIINDAGEGHEASGLEGKPESREDGGIDARAIFEAEVAALTGAGETQRSATQGGPVNPDGSPHRRDGEPVDGEPVDGESVDGESVDGEPVDGEPDDGEDTDSGADENEGQTDGEEQGKNSQVKKQRNDWKKEALESRQLMREMQAQMAALNEKITQPQQSHKPEKQGDSEEFVPPEIDLSKLDLSQEAKDFLEYTPGIDKMISHIVNQQVSAFVENIESRRQVEQTEAITAKEAETKEQQFWSEMDGWFSGEYPELSLQDIRNSPDFNDWLEFRKNWVDAQLSGKGRYETSGAQEIYKRYIREHGLATESSDDTGSESNARRLASARTPRAGGRKPPPQNNNAGNVFNDEVKRLKEAGSYNRRFV